MNEGRLSTEQIDVASQGTSNSQLSTVNGEALTQTSVESQSQISVFISETLSQRPTPSEIQFSSIVVEALRQVPVMRANLTPVLN